MSQNRLSTSKRRVCYLRADARFFDAQSAFLEKRLKGIGTIELAQILSLDSPEAKPCDLLLLNGSAVPKEKLGAWIQKHIAGKMIQGGLESPVLVFADLDFSDLIDLWDVVYAENRYFDFISPKELHSLPIRMANLLRIHDHLHEVARFQRELSRLSDELAQIRQGLKP